MLHCPIHLQFSHLEKKFLKMSGLVSYQYIWHVGMSACYVFFLFKYQYIHVEVENVNMLACYVVDTYYRHPPIHVLQFQTSKVFTCQHAYNFTLAMSSIYRPLKCREMPTYLHLPLSIYYMSKLLHAYMHVETSLVQ